MPSVILALHALHEAVTDCFFNSFLLDVPNPCVFYCVKVVFIISKTHVYAVFA